MIYNYFQQCTHRWKKSTDPRIKRGGWTVDEDIKLLRAVQEMGEEWARIRDSKVLEDADGTFRTDMQMRDRFHNVLHTFYNTSLGAPVHCSTRNIHVQYTNSSPNALHKPFLLFHSHTILASFGQNSAWKSYTRHGSNGSFDNCYTFHHGNRTQSDDGYNLDSVCSMLTAYLPARQ